MKIAAALIVKGSDEEALLLDRCLESIAPYVDGIFITRTHRKGEKPNENVKKVALKYKAVVSDFEWCYDFAAARNFNFSQVPKEFEYILWSDADDIWRGLDKLRTTLDSYPQVDALGFLYLYDWDEFKNPTVVHRKTMLVKNDGCTEWVGAIHEDLQEKRQLDVQLVNGIERLHLTTKERSDENAKRNLEISAREVEINPDDPRSYFNLGNSQFGVSDFTGAQKSFETFLETSESDDEKYLALQRLADVYKSTGNSKEAIKSLHLAIGLQPDLPDAYLFLAHLYYSLSNFDMAEKYCLTGMVRRPRPEKMIVFNPRDYDYNPMMLLARVYYEKNRPDLMLPLLKGCLKIYPKDKHLQGLVKEGEKEVAALEKALKKVKKLETITDKVKLRAELDKLPDEIKSHPAVCVIRNTNFVKEESTGKDMVIYCGNTTHQWNPEMFKTKGVGGSEEAVIHLAREWVKLGWNVTVYNNCGHKPVFEPVRTIAPNPAFQPEPSVKAIGVTYRPFWEFNYRDKQDVVILWRWAKPLDYAINAPKVFIDLHDVVPEGEFTEKRLQKLSKIFVKTQFHRSLFPNVPDEKIVVIPNGMETYLDESIKKDPKLVINTSSPDRSMDVLPKLWRRVTAQVPDAKLKWAYGFEIFKNSYAADEKKMEWMNNTIKDMEDAGIEILGRLSQSEVGKLYQEASFLAYPTEFAEIDCISVKKAQAARCIPVATDFGALKESIKYGVMVHSKKDKHSWARPYQFHFGLEDEKAQDEWVDAMVSLLKGTTIPLDGLEEWREEFKWETIAKRWNEILCAS